MATFTQIVKEEICRQTYSKEEIRAILSSYLKNNISINISNDKIFWEIKTQSSLIARFLSSIISELYEFKKEFSFDEENKTKKTRVYRIKFFGDFNIIQHDLLLLKSSNSLLKNETTKKGFLIGCFLSGGSVNNPENSNYHLEIKFSNKGLINDAYKVMSKIIPTSKRLQRKNTYFIYIKKSEQISDFLKFIGATNAMFKYEEKRIYRDYSNQMHRLNNLDISNFTKSMSASTNQILWINEIKKNIVIFNSFTDKEKMFCELRLTHSDSSLIEISKLFLDIFQIKISKSALNHYVRKIKQIYMEIIEKTNLQ